MDQYNEKQLQGKKLVDEGNYHDALTVINELLDEDPNDGIALFLLGRIFISTDKRGLAYNIFARCLKNNQHQSAVWVNYGRSQNDDPEGWAASEYCFLKALEIDPDSRGAMSNMAALEVQRCRPDKAIEWAERCMKTHPDYTVAITARGFARLMKQDWGGWEDYHHMVGSQGRPDVIYGDLPMWDGEKGKTIIVAGEQGIGDEIVFASVLEDLAAENTVVYDCMPRLESLMARSLPNVHVTGQRWGKDFEMPQGLQADAYAPQALIPVFYRQTAEKFTGAPYLTADPQKCTAMQAVLDSLGPNPKVGITWTGGTGRSRKHFRQRTLEEYTPLLRTPGVEWVSLEYHDRSEEIEEYAEKRGIRIHQFPWITAKGLDYDLTAALVASLDLVITVPTSVSQLAGGLGKEAWVMVPEITGWLFYGGADRGESYPWAESVRLFQNKPVKYVADELRKWLNGTRQLRQHQDSVSKLAG